MSATAVLIVVAAWSTVGFVVALFLGRLFRNAAPAPEESRNRLVC